MLSASLKRDVAIHVSSAYRSPNVNARIGGSKTSDHMKGLAADIIADGVSVHELAEFISNNCEFDQLINEFGSWVHVSIQSPGRKRMQRMTARNVNGKTEYT
jgi:hypothetical protein